MAFTRQAKQQILDAILMRNVAVEGGTDLMSFLGRVWPLEQMPSEDYRFKTASGDIHKHMVMNVTGQRRSFTRDGWRFSMLRTTCSSGS
jgi:hypothetical protein